MSIKKDLTVLLVLLTFNIATSLIFISCQKEEEIKVMDTMENEILHGSIEFPVITKFAADVFEIDSLLVVITPFSSDGIFSVYSKHTGHEKFTLRKRGNGPDEYLQPGIYKSGSNLISLWDTNKKFSEINPVLNGEGEITFNLLSSRKINQGGMKIFRFNQDMLISNIHPHSGMFALFNNQGEIIGDYFGKSPLQNVSDNYERFQGLIAVSSQQKVFIYGTSDLGYLCAYELNEMNQPVLKWEYYIHQRPFYKFTNENLEWDEQNHVKGIKGIQIHQNKIIVLYSGKSISLPGNKPEGAFSDNLYVMNTEGEILKKYKLDTPVLKCYYSEKDSALYGITITDDWQIVKFQVDLGAL